MIESLQVAPSQKLEFEFSQQDFEMISKLVHSDFGLSLPESKKPLVYSRLSKRLRKLQLNDFSEYCRFVVSDEGADERGRMLSALTTNVSHFFREQHHFDMLEQKILPDLIERARAGGRVRLWSAGCSAGQEPYSIAFTILKLCPDAERLDIKILATDIDDVILSKAKSGEYSSDDVGTNGDKLKAWISQADGTQDVFQVVPQAQRLVAFAKLNLVGPWPRTNFFDVVFCRNVAIYFDRETQGALWSNFAGRITPGGHLMIGHSERLTDNVAGVFDPAGITAYQKKNVG